MPEEPDDEAQGVFEEMLFEQLVFGSPARPEAEQADEEEEGHAAWLPQHRQAAAQGDASVALRRHPNVQKAVLGVRQAVSRLTAGSPQNLKLLGQRLSARYGWSVALRTSVPPSRADRMRRVQHSFLVCRPMAGTHGLEVVIDPAFRAQFEVGRPSRQFSAFLATCVPEVFVGTVEMLAPLVAAAASAVAACFADLDMPLPPWRCPDSLLSRWRATEGRDEACDAKTAIEEELLASRRRVAAARAAAAATAAAATTAEAAGSPGAAPAPISPVTTPAFAQIHSAVAPASASGTPPAPLRHVVGFRIPSPHRTAWPDVAAAASAAAAAASVTLPQAVVTILQQQSEPAPGLPCVGVPPSSHSSSACSASASPAVQHTAAAAAAAVSLVALETGAGARRVPVTATSAAGGLSASVSAWQLPRSNPSGLQALLLQPAAVRAIAARAALPFRKSLDALLPTIRTIRLGA